MSNDPKKRASDRMQSAFGASAGVRNFAPHVDVRMSDERVLFVLDVPGLELRDLQVQINESMLTVAGRRRFEASDANEQLIIGRGYGAFRNSFRLPAWADPQSLTARLHNGVLTVELSRRGTRRRAALASSPQLRALPPRRNDEGDDED